jgi:hypothetical protein
VTANHAERLLWSTEGNKFIPGEKQLPLEARKRKRNVAIKRRAI